MSLTYIRTALVTTFCLFTVLAARSTMPRSQSYLSGKVIDVSTQLPVPYADIVISEINRSAQTDSDGNFMLPNLPEGTFTAKVLHVAYREGRFSVMLTARDTTNVLFTLRPNSLSTEDIVVVGEREDISELEKAAVDVSGEKLRKNLGLTIAETIDQEAGLAQRTLGPAPARPVIRGLDGDRVLIVQDGDRNGDLSATAFDHAVAIDPLTSNRIEVIRGPRALTLGSNTLGGVVNVVRETVPNSMPQKITGSAGLTGETVNNGYAGGLSLKAPVQPFVLHLDGSYREAGELQTPEGTLRNTSLLTQSAAAGISWIQSWGHLGVAADVYLSEYGIPPDENGRTGIHKNGIDINMERSKWQSTAELIAPVDGIRRIEAEYDYTRYQHKEFERQDILGSEFGLITQNTKLNIYAADNSWLKNAQIGLWREFRDFASGARATTPATEEISWAGYAYNEFKLGSLQSSVALRFESKNVNPVKRDTVFNVGVIRERNFTNWAAALKTRLPLNKHYYVSGGIIRSFRAPSVEELFSNGPHLAAYSFEIGNPDLDEEETLGAEVTAGYSSDDLDINLTLFHNRIDGYLYPAFTGKKSGRRADLDLYRVVGQDVTMQGFESTADLRLGHHFQVDGTLSYVEGTIRNNDEPLPRIPPFTYSLGLNHKWNGLTSGIKMRGASSQQRTGEFETSTPAYVVFDLYAEYLLQGGGLLHSFSLAVENTLDTTYRQHLNRIKDITPEAGRDFRLLYKVFF